MSKQRRSRRDVLTAAGVAGITALAGCIGGGGGGNGGGGNGGGGNGGGGNGSNGSGSNGSGGGNGNASGGGQGGMADQMTVFHAGSLSPPFSNAEPKFEEQYGVDVVQETAGSVASTKKITAQGQEASVLGVSDFRLLRDTLLPEFGNWYSIFATNAMTIAYTEQSAGAEEVGPENWWEILSRDDVAVAHSDPALDPNGYRSIMSMQLGKMEFQGQRLYDDATYQALRQNAKVTAEAESGLMGQLQAGALDYAWEYQSAGATHDVKTIDLQEQIDLSKLTKKYAKFYSNAKVETESGTYTGAPIAYGITVPSVANAPQLGALWVEFMITKPGQQILNKTGFNPVQPAVVPKASQNAVPKPVAKHAEAKNKIGPLQLSDGSSSGSGSS
jgi:molybdate/tungstate transport system substrate-binding protein